LTPSEAESSTGRSLFATKVLRRFLVQTLWCGIILPTLNDPDRPNNPHTNNMKQILRAIPISLCLSFMASSHVLAQKTYAIGLGGGTAIPVGKLNDAQKAGYNGMAMLAMGVADLPFGVRFDAIYNTLTRRADTIAQGSSASTSDFRVMGALANLIYAFPGTSAKAYIVAGAGLYNSKVEPNGKSQNHLGFNAGLGATFGVGPLATFIESRYHSISRSTADGGVYQFVPITVGLMF
jgi:hypothetical protein